MEDICGYQIFIIVTDTNNSKDKYKYKYRPRGDPPNGSDGQNNTTDRPAQHATSTRPGKHIVPMGQLVAVRR